MQQLFPRFATPLARYTLYGAPVALLALYVVVVALDWSPWQTREGQFVEQPVPFSHEHHVSGLGIDCRYCHTSVETSSFAGLPPTHTCMSCHSQLFTESPMLAPVRASYRTGRPIQWQRVYDLPDYVYFDHSVHVRHGVGCETCHGRVDRMPLTYEAQALFMRWCLDCHRDPAKYLRPPEAIYAFGYALPADAQRRVGRALVAAYGIDPGHLDDCSTCHR